MRQSLTGLCLAAVLAAAAFSAGKGERSAAKSAKPATAPIYGNADAINEQELKIYDYFLASDQLEGRNFPSRGYDTAALYVASHLAEWGLLPGGSAAGTNGPLQPYFMPIELVARQVLPGESKLSLTAPAGGRGAGTNVNTGPKPLDFSYGREWNLRGTPAELDVSGGLVFAGNGYVIRKTNIDPYAGIDVRGKIIVVAGVPPEIAARQAGRGGGRGRSAANPPEAPGDAPAQPAGGGRGAPNPLGEPCKDFLTPEQYAAQNGALAVITVPSFQQLTTFTNPNAAGGRGGPNGPNYQVVRFPPAGACPSMPSLLAGVELTTALFQGEKVNGAQVFYAAGSNSKQASFEFDSRKSLKAHIGIRADAGHGENVVAILEGSDPVLKNEYVVITAHLDHIGLSAPQPDGHNINNGADDDGSGSAGLLAIARAFADGAAKGIRPKRSVIFLWLGGEEKGLWGSQYFTEFPPVDLSKVVADLNMDMIGRTKNAKSVDPNPTHVLVDPGEVMVIGPNVSSDDLGQTIDLVNSNYQKLKLNHFYDVTAPDATHDNLGPQPNGQRVFYRSDHYNFAKVGIPIAFFSGGLHVDYHRPTDTPDKIDFKEMQQVSKTVAAVGWELANQPGRPKLKEKLPDQLLRDMKLAQEQGWGKVTPVLPPLTGMPY